MASQTLKQRFKDDSTTPATNTRPEKKTPKPKRAIRSLAIAIMVPLSLTLAVIFFFGSSPKYHALAKPFWFPPLWFINLASLASSFLMGLAAWLVWAEGGFHSQSDALPLYISQVSLSITWLPLVLKIGAVPIGFVFSVIHFGTLVACYRDFRRVNPIAGDLVKPCLAWEAFLTIVNYKLIYL
ncbi:hypothetical protein L1049_017062 [Liquidambar formosana]|uniref:Translocator protein homolog n=1 Tax=Liquidambar formosana TaxID=63359 RepID=A0AAP0S0D2_LIQFO